MLATWRAFLLNNIRAWDIPGGGEWSALLHNNYHPHYSGINLLWFRGSDPFPLVVTKLHSERGIIEHEFNNLRRVYSPSSNCSPRPLHCGLIGDHWALWMTGVPGHSFPLRDSYTFRAVESVADTVIALHRGMGRPRDAADDSRHSRMVLEPLKAVADFGASPAIHDGCKRLAETVSKDWITSLPVIPQHGDLYVGNLLSHRDRWRIVDWESFGSIDLPLYDLLTFCLSVLRTGGNVADQWRSSMVQQASPLIKRYCDAFGLSPEDSRTLLPLTLANWFHLQWADGRQEFSRELYKSIDQYFRCQNLWERILSIPGGN
jgi:aminoglycoside phosphotransferase (APT) family kinase protein